MFVIQTTPSLSDSELLVAAELQQRFPAYKFGVLGNTVVCRTADSDDLRNIDAQNELEISVLRFIISELVADRLR